MPMPWGGSRDSEKHRSRRVVCETPSRAVGRHGLGPALINSTIVAVSQVVLILALCSTGA